MLPPTAERVSRNTAEEINERIRRETDARVAHCAGEGPEAIDRRLDELDEEWDIERAVETLAPSLTLTGLLLAATGSRKWLILPAVVQAFFLQHALQGWCPPVPVLRQMGVHTRREIDRELFALKVLRGDFQTVSLEGNPDAALNAVKA